MLNGMQACNGLVHRAKIAHCCLGVLDHTSSTSSAPIAAVAKYGGKEAEKQ